MLALEISKRPCICSTAYWRFRDQFPHSIRPCEFSASHATPACTVVTVSFLKDFHLPIYATLALCTLTYCLNLPFNFTAQSSRLALQDLFELIGLFFSIGEIRLSDHWRLPHGHCQRYRISPASHHRCYRLCFRHHHLVPHMRSWRGKTSYRQKSCLVSLSPAPPTSATSGFGQGSGNVYIVGDRCWRTEEQMM